MWYTCNERYISIASNVQRILSPKFSFSRFARLTKPFSCENRLQPALKVAARLSQKKNLTEAAGRWRGGAFCCASNRIYLCHDNPWVGCRELAYELSHALNVCRGLVRCARDGMVLDGRDCGYLSPPDVACSELRASFWTGRCAGREGARLRDCMEWHARWAVASVYPDDEHLEAHVRWARHRCAPAGADVTLTDGSRRAEALRTPLVTDVPVSGNLVDV